ncbi:hypothetical protein Tco_0208555, partial [Tanacetum coccineum]
RGDKPLLLWVPQGPTLQEQVEAIMGNKGLLLVTTAKGKDTSQANGQIIHEEELAFLADPDNMDNNMINQAVQYVIESQQAAVQNSNSSAQQDALILYVIEQLKTQVVNCTKMNLDNKSVNDTLTAELERYKE